MIDTTTESESDIRKIARALLVMSGGIDAALAEWNNLGPGESVHIGIAQPATATGENLDRLAPLAMRGPDQYAAAPPPPPPPAGPVATGGNDDDELEVETDGAGTVVGLTTSAALPAAAPPPPPAVPAPPGPPAAVELDSRGMPWDGRIHAANRAKKIDGSWKNKRGVTADLVTAVEATHKAAPVVQSAATPAAAPVDPPSAPPPPAAPAAPAAPPTVSVPAASAVAAGIPAPSSALDFRGLMIKIQRETVAGRLSSEQVNAALAGVGLKPEEMAVLANNAPLIASVNAAIDACLIG